MIGKETLDKLFGALKRAEEASEPKREHSQPGPEETKEESPPTTPEPTMQDQLPRAVFRCRRT